MKNVFEAADCLANSDSLLNVNLAGDIITEKFNAGIDAAKSKVAYVLRGHLESLTLIGTANINGTGNSLANIVIGNSANNTLKLIGLL